MSDSSNKTFAFDVTLSKAYKADDGKMHVIGVASDDDVDLTGDKMHEKALESMVTQAKKNKLPLLDSHHGTFGFGHTHDAHIQKKGGKREYVVDFELDDRYPQAHDLYNEVSSGTSQKQLSIGGHLNRADPEAVEHEVDKKTGRYARTIKKITLDHIATTRPKRAAVPGARFIDAIVKSVFDGEALPSSDASVGDVVKGSIQVNKHMLDQGSAWSFSGSDGDALVAKGGWPLFKAAHTWFDSATTATPETKGAYKFPHHKLSGGEMKTYRKGVVAAMIRHASSDISIAEKNVVRSHLASHYKEFGMEVPEDKHFVSTESLIKFHEDQGMKMKWFREEEQVLEKAKVQAQAALSGNEAANEKETAGMGDTNVNKTASDAKAAETGLQVLTSIGKLFAPKDAGGEPIPEHIQVLGKAIDGVIAKGVSGGAIPEVTKMTTALMKFLSGAGIKMLDDEKNEALGKSLPFDEKKMGELVEKTIAGKLEGAAKDLNATITQITEALAKGLTDMAGGINTKLESVQKSVDDRVAKLEKLSGVRQSIPGQESPLNKSNEGGNAPEGNGSRKPDAANPFRGMFDGVRRQALARMGNGGSPK